MRYCCNLCVYSLARAASNSGGGVFGSVNGVNSVVSFVNCTVRSNSATSLGKVCAESLSGARLCASVVLSTQALEQGVGACTARLAAREV